MEIKGYDAKTVTAILAAVDSINPMNGIVTKQVDYAVSRLLIDARFLWEDEDGDLFEDCALSNWQREGGDVHQLAKIFNLDIEITL